MLEKLQQHIYLATRHEDPDDVCETLKLQEGNLIFACPPGETLWYRARVSPNSHEQ